MRFQTIEEYRASRDDEVVKVFELDEGDVVCCYYCQKEFGRGGGCLCGPEHAPLNGNANYVCNAHLEKNIRRVDLYKPKGK